MPQQVGTLVKAMNLLDVLAESAPIGVMELSRRLEMDKSGVSRLLTTFRSRNYVRVVEDGRYDLGLRLFELGQLLQDRMPFRKAIIPHVDSLSRETGETAFAVHYSHGAIAYLYGCVSTQDIRLGERAGILTAPWNHAAGIAILAFRDEVKVLDELSAVSKKKSGLPAADAFRHNLPRVRKQGYASQHDAEKCLVAVPLLRDTGPVSTALMLGGPAFRMGPSRTKSLARILIQRAREVSLSLARIAKP